MDHARSRTPASRLGHVPLSMGTAAVNVHDRVHAPFNGSSRLYAGRVLAMHETRKVLHVRFDDGDEDFNVKVSTIKHEAGAQACWPRKKHKSAAAVMKMRSPKPVSRLCVARAKTAAPPAQPADPDWVHHGLVAVKIVATASGQQHYEDLAGRMVFTFKWLYVGEKHDVGTPFPPHRTSEITLRAIVDAKPHVAGMHVVALRHWLLDLAQAQPMHAIAAAHMFGSFDPILH